MTALGSCAAIQGCRWPCERFILRPREPFCPWPRERLAPAELDENRLARGEGDAFVAAMTGASTFHEEGTA